jgi:type IV secretory pathway TrbD component
MNKILQESITIVTLIIQTRRRVIIVTSLIVGALILALMSWMKLVVGVDEVEVLLGFGAGIA